ncbi:MAG: hypothetical protein HYZ54_00130 [Ignavibacteriae bacterium]|nr:hypothetical protein [Ignavibacteriota bacterium]
MKSLRNRVNLFSYFRNREIAGLSVICILLTAQVLSGCYSFTGGTIPPHLKTITVLQVTDNSGIGNPRYREILTQQLIEKFRNDNSFEFAERNGDAQLTTTIISITDATVAVGAGELERERKAVVTVEAEYFDFVKKKNIWKKSFSTNQIYAVSEGQSGRDAAVESALKLMSNDLLTAVVSGW